MVDYDLILTADLCCGISGLQLSQKLNKLFHSSSMKAPKSASVLWKEGGGTERVSVKTKNIANTISVLRKILERLKWDAETSSLTSWHDSCCPLCRGSDTEYLLVFESATADGSAASALEVVGPAASLRLNEPALALPIVREQSSLQKLIRAVQRFWRFSNQCIVVYKIYAWIVSSKLVKIENW